MNGNTLTNAARSIGEAIPVPTGAICQRADEIRREQSMTHDIIGDLEMRLEAVLAGKPVEPKANGPQAIRSNDSPLHGALGDILDHAEGLNARLRGLMNRITV